MWSLATEMAVTVRSCASRWPASNPARADQVTAQVWRHLRARSLQCLAPASDAAPRQSTQACSARRICHTVRWPRLNQVLGGEPRAGLVVDRDRGKAGGVGSADHDGWKVLGHLPQRGGG